MAESPESKKRASDRPPSLPPSARKPTPSVDELLEGLTKSRTDHDA